MLQRYHGKDKTSVVDFGFRNQNVIIVTLVVSSIGENSKTYSQIAYYYDPDFSGNDQISNINNMKKIW